MKQTEIKNKKSGKIIYAGEFKTFRDCLETAVKDNVDLCGADLTHKNLSHANLDDARLDHAAFFGSNLIGINLSEASLNHADFMNCSLESACLAFSSLKNCNVTGARFGGTYIEGAVIDGAHFSGLSCLYLDLIDTQSMAGCLYKDEYGAAVSFSSPPILLHGLPKHIAIIGDRIGIGAKLYTPRDVAKLNDPLLYHYRDLLDNLMTCKKLETFRLLKAA